MIFISKPRQSGMAIWVLLLLLSGVVGWQRFADLSLSYGREYALHKTMAALSVGQQALLAYAQQPLGSPVCGLNCSRPGDLPCPDRNNDGIAETSCSNTARLGRLPWKTLGIGDVRDGSGERLWYVVSERYKNNPRMTPLNLDTPGSWSVATVQGVRWDGSQGGGVVAVVIAPMYPLVREDGWRQLRSAQNTEVAKQYLDMLGVYDNANPLEGTRLGLVMAPATSHFNDVIWPLTASQMHQVMQKQVLAEVARSLRCSAQPCLHFPLAATMEDVSCLGSLSLNAGQCLATAGSLGRLPVSADAHWPLATQHLLDGNAQHHWFQQNGWREQVFYLPSPGQASIVVGGEALSGQLRNQAMDKARVSAYLEASTLQQLHSPDASALLLLSNDVIDRVTLP